MKSLPKNILNSLLCVVILLVFSFAYRFITLPDVGALKDRADQAPIQIYTHDGLLIAEIGEKQRIPIPYEQAPKALIHAIIATEDRRFFLHGGIDLWGLLRASRELIMTGKKSQGASTITMQLARNCFLTRKKTFSRKINEMLLALKIERHFSKKDILELYVNQIFLGYRAYGFAAAAQTYYGKTLDQLSLPQLAMLAGLPKAPSRDNPIVNPLAAIKRRNHVLKSMLEVHAIDIPTYQKAIAAPITAKHHFFRPQLDAPYVRDMVRDGLSVMRYNQDQGIRVYTTIDARLQRAANHILPEGLLDYSYRHGYLGPEGHFRETNNLIEWQHQLKNIPTAAHCYPAVVLGIRDQNIDALLSNGMVISIPWEGYAWAMQPTDHELNIQRGDLIRVAYQPQNILPWMLTQVPKVQGALVSIRSSDGAIQAINGGFDYQSSVFNRATQAWRQPGSCFKPFIYAAALEQGATLSTIINDAPIVLKGSGEDAFWRPHNASARFYGPTRLRMGLVRSRNLVSIRLLQQTGIPYVRRYVSLFGFDMHKQPKTLSLALGSGSVTPIQLANAYGIIANGGYAIRPYLIERIEDRKGHILYTHPTHTPPRRMSAAVNFLIHDALKDVIHQGTARGAQILNREDIAGKTGTTNQQMDAWFSGYGGHLSTTVWVGFDQGGQSVGEYGVKAAMPIWIRFMRVGLSNQPLAQRSCPSNIVHVPIDPNTGLLAYPGKKDAVEEYFRLHNLPKTFVPKQEIMTQNDLLDQPKGIADGLF